jgi:hypothetical protein
MFHTKTLSQLTLADTAQRIIELWQGSILYDDKAFQLLHIIDSICDWARDIFREDIIWLLKGGERRSPTTDSNILSQINGFGISASPSRVQTMSPILIEEDVKMEDESYFDNRYLADALSSQRSEPRHSGPVTPSHPFLRYKYQNSHSEWSIPASIRHASIVKFDFWRLRIDEQGVEILFRNARDKNRFPRRLLHTLNQNPVVVDVNTLEWIEALWIGVDPLPRGSEPCEDSEFARIAYYTYLDSDWQIVRALVCITGGGKALNALRDAIGNRAPQTPSLSSAWKVPSEALKRAISQIRSWNDTNSLLAAMLLLRWDLEDLGSVTERDGRFPSTWNGKPENLTFCREGQCTDNEIWAKCANSHDAELLDMIQFSNEFFACRSTLEQVTLKQANQTRIFDVPEMPTLVLKLGVILLRSPRVGIRGDIFCAMVLDESGVEDLRYIGKRIHTALMMGGVYSSRLLSFFETKCEVGKAELTELDKKTLTQWEDILTGRTSEQDVDWD